MGPLTPAGLSGATGVSPREILSELQQVADWQLAHPSQAPPTDWVPAVFDAGMMALAGISGESKYRDAMLAVGKSNGWRPGTRIYHADDHCIGQTYSELYFLYREPAMIAPLRERFDTILANPPANTNLDFNQPGHGQDRWSWCDALFMGPPAWVRLYAATGDTRYLDFAVKNWWITTDFLYDKDEHLYFRDSTFFNQHGANGKNVFWSRGNGWVMAGLVRMLQSLPTNHHDRARFEQLFKDMAGKILTCQQSDGLWRASLLDPENYSAQETSGSGFYTYALTWGVNQGLLDRARFEPAVRRAWAALVRSVDADGKLTHVQPIGSNPQHFAPDSSTPFGAGAFLLAGSEIYRLAVFERARTSSRADGAFQARLSPGAVAVKITNPSGFRRESETVEIDPHAVLRKLLGAAARGANTNYNSAAKQFFDRSSLAVMDGVSARIIDSQLYASEPAPIPNKLLFQVDLAPGETRTFYILNSRALAAAPQPIVKTSARFVPERYDDFAWESDRIAHRAYGLALVSAENTVSSAPDVWVKRGRGLVVDAMYRSKRYHDYNPDADPSVPSGIDDYRVGHSRGCGGLGIWDGKTLYTSSNFSNWRVITTGPIRSEFELTYDAWDAGNGAVVSEVKRYSIDAGSWFTKAQSTFHGKDTAPLTIGVGLAERACGPAGEEQIASDRAEGWMTYWQPEDKPKGHIGVAIVLPKGSVISFTNDAPNMSESEIHAVVPGPTVEGAPAIRDLLAITKAGVGRPFTYYFGAGWDRSGDFAGDQQWEEYVRRFAERRDHPLRVEIAF
jgi:unsaturated rhamnogalacturonyl hydrolase